MSASTKTAGASPALRWAVIAAIAGIAFFASYRYAVASVTNSQTATGAASSGPAGTVTSVSGGSGCCGGRGGSGTTANVGTGTGTTTGSAASGAGCCGGSGGGAGIKKSAQAVGAVQKITVDMSKGYFDPNSIQLKAGVPAEITFGQSSGCTAQVQSQDLNFAEDLTSGPKTVKLPALKAGTYTFACGMNMQSGTIVVK